MWAADIIKVTRTSVTNRTLSRYELQANLNCIDELVGACKNPRKWMFGRLKNLFRKRPDEEPFAEAPPGAPPQEVKSSPIPALRPPARPGARPTFAPVARPSPAPQTAPAPVAAQTPRPVGGDSLKLSLKPILLTLPDILKAKVRQPNAGGAQISVPVQKILPQLAFGSIKITFGELRQAAPAGVFTDASDQDQAPVELPLQEILSQLKPDQLSRRSAQKCPKCPGRPWSRASISSSTPRPRGRCSCRSFPGRATA